MSSENEEAPVKRTSPGVKRRKELARRPRRKSANDEAQLERKKSSAIKPSQDDCSSSMSDEDSMDSGTTNRNRKNLAKDSKRKQNLKCTPPRGKRKKSSAIKPTHDGSSSSMSDEESIDLRTTNRKRKKLAKDSKRNQTVGYKCSPSRLKSLLNQLNDHQRQWVIDAGFGVLFEICDCNLPRRLTLMLINRVNYRTGALELGGGINPNKTIRPTSKHSRRSSFLLCSVSTLRQPAAFFSTGTSCNP